MEILFFIVAHGQEFVNKNFLNFALADKPHIGQDDIASTLAECCWEKGFSGIVANLKVGIRHQY